MATRAKATATVTITANWTQAVVDAIQVNNAPVLNVVGYKGGKLVLRVAIDDLADWTGFDRKVPAAHDAQDKLVHTIVTELLKPIGGLSNTEIAISDLVVG
jgi:hypothetical protein